MAATIKFYGNGYLIPTTAGSGIGFFTGSFGGSCPVGSFANKTYITSSDGVSQGPELDTCQWINVSGCAPGGVGALRMKQLPNDQATFEIRAEFDTAVKVPTATLYVYDRSSVSNPPSGLVMKLYQCLHTNPSQALPDGSGLDNWETPAGSSVMSLAPSPGSGGLFAGNGTNGSISSTVHSWFVAASASPSVIGSRLGAVLVNLEYL